MKMSLMSKQDIAAMYKARGSSNSVFLWVEPGEQDNDDTPIDVPLEKKRKRSARHEKEEEIDEIFEQLSEEHSESYTVPQLRLWAHDQKPGTANYTTSRFGQSRCIPVGDSAADTVDVRS